MKLIGIVKPYKARSKAKAYLLNETLQSQEQLAAEAL